MVPVKLLILGAQNTGKTALCVRFITKRFIGEYDHKTEVTYRCSRTVDQETVDLEILDLPCKNSVASIESSIRWADGFLLLYSITQRSSFLEIPRLKTLIDKTKQSLVFPTVLVANKADLEVGRKVTTEEGQRLAKDLGFCILMFVQLLFRNVTFQFVSLLIFFMCLMCRCGFRELSVAEAVLSVEAVIFQLIRLTLDQQRPLPDRRSYMLTVRHALTRKLTRSKTMQW
ncbi:ras-related and estrogen-regulated growth inhibitor-like isoform X1 [Xiphophorus maculatus]|uniref:ras-related and estrogen-regulated growth inhibitor-like isoform X1 n=1 Tax=Xiphophorus maculatus TaxID=8083 RepID=UPI000C6CC04E|nr:ras-related and estrogen-regulated growth inhibitor-like isoform X1 [Xiphophorus maculatus]